MLLELSQETLKVGQESGARALLLFPASSSPSMPVLVPPPPLKESAMGTNSKMKLKIKFCFFNSYIFHDEGD